MYIYICICIYIIYIYGCYILTPFLYIPMYYLPPPLSLFFQILLDLPLPRSICCLVSLTEWTIATHFMSYFLLNEIMDLYMLSHGSLVPQRPYIVFYGTRHQFTEF